MAPPTDEELMDFDTDRMPKWDEGRATRLLTELPELYRNHLAVAHCLAWTADNLDHRAGPDGGSADLRGYERALRDTAARLRQGDYVPGGVLYGQRWPSES
jgi:hypothetical protein